MRWLPQILLAKTIIRMFLTFNSGLFHHTALSKDQSMHKRRCPKLGLGNRGPQTIYLISLSISFLIFFKWKQLHSLFSQNTLWRLYKIIWVKVTWEVWNDTLGQRQFSDWWLGSHLSLTKSKSVYPRRDIFIVTALKNWLYNPHLTDQKNKAQRA